MRPGPPLWFEEPQHNASWMHLWQITPVFRTGVNWAPILLLARVLSHHKTVFLRGSILGVEEVTGWPRKSRFICVSCRLVVTPIRPALKSSLLYRQFWKGLRVKLRLFPQAWRRGIQRWQPSCSWRTSDAAECMPRAASERPTQGNWIWMQPCENFNPCVESDFCAFGCERRCSLFVLCVARRWVILLNQHHIFNKTILWAFLCSQCLILNCPGITLASVRCNGCVHSSRAHYFLE